MKPWKHLKRMGLPLAFYFLYFLYFLTSENLYAASLSGLDPLIGKQDAVLVADNQGNILFSKHENTPLIPASTLKILTAVLALSHLGSDYRFHTDFYLDDGNRLIAQGFGDPLLVSESLSAIAKTLANQFRSIHGIILDDTHFAKPLEIPGISDSFEPYDAPNGALCVNFNTVFFQRAGSRFVSAEPKTPLLPMVMSRILNSRMDQGRIVLSNKQGEATLYAGQMLRHFLEKEGITVTGKVETGRADPAQNRLILRYVSEHRLSEVVEKLLEHSNNFIANQLLISVGVKVYGPPGTLEKGVRAAMSDAEKVLKTNGIQIVEGSGISRENRMTVLAMHRVLNAFISHRHLMGFKNGVFYKTGTLDGVRTLAGYIETRPERIYPFAIFINTPGKTADDILMKIRTSLP
ncbi:MAG: hypothetical protein COX20_03305 [Desulfobacterales bacterium CG23_combo_of_CG06-09_8_20_14_all_52_9]|nr:MAG: hypothetical protein COX20_03305 [Desulfobacterales bacterium CG23_combo_of_CG06-09_8_20_14_all_52_9]